MGDATSIRFVKVHGLGNDFVLIDQADPPDPPDPTDPSVPVTPDLVRRMCDRHRGIGADGVLLVLPGDAGLARMRILNADGTVAEMCGNGIRCFARHLSVERGLTGDEILVDTDAGPKRCLLRRGPDGAVDAVRVAMGPPRLAAEDVPLRPGLRDVVRHYEVAGTSYRGRALSMGNPHLVLVAGRSDPEEARRLGMALSAHPDFPEGTNVELVAVRGSRALDVTVYERGVGLTQACGTGACAAVVAAALDHHVAMGEAIRVRLPGGVATVEIAPDYEEVWLEGPATEVFRGVYPGPTNARRGPA